MAKFEKGTSGNPGGRPKEIAEVRDLAREHTPEAINTLVEIMQGKDSPPAARVSAANALLDRGYGRPAQTIQAEVSQSAPANNTLIVASLRAMLAGTPVRTPAVIDAGIVQDAP